MAAAGLKGQLLESPSGAPLARLEVTDGIQTLPVVLQLPEDTLVITAEIAEMSEPDENTLMRLDAIAEGWPRGSLSWDRATGLSLGRAHLDAPVDRPPLGSDLRTALAELAAAAPMLAKLELPPLRRVSTPSPSELTSRFAEQGLPLSPLGEGVWGQRVRHPDLSIGSFGFALGIDEGRGFWIEGELLDGTPWPAGRAGSLLANDLRNVLDLGTVVLREGRAVWRASYARLSDDPLWPRRALAAASSAVGDLFAHSKGR
jgi:hypothetical protein